MIQALLTVYILIAIILFIYILNHRAGGPIPENQMDFMDWLWFFISLAVFCLCWPGLVVLYALGCYDGGNDEF